MLFSGKGYQLLSVFQSNKGPTVSFGLSQSFRISGIHVRSTS
jgi:hypothetical protein